MMAYINFMRGNYETWMGNTINQEKEDWKSNSEPEIDMENCYYTSSPVLIYKMVDDNLEVSNTISQDLVQRTLQISIDQVITFGNLYRQAMNEYLNEKSPGILFTKYIIAIANNCEKFEAMGQDTRKRWWKPGHLDVDSSHSFEDLINTFESIKEETITYLLNLSFMDIEEYFSQLFTEDWKTSSIAIENICDKLNEYFENYDKLKTSNYCLLFSSTQDRVASQYITAMMRRKVVFTTEEERKSAADKIKSESALCKEFFTAVAGDKIDAEFDSPFNTVDALAGVLSADEEMLSFELITLRSKYSDLTEDHMLCLLLLRGLSRNEAKQVAADIGPEVEQVNKTFNAKSILSQVTITASLMDKLFGN